MKFYPADGQKTFWPVPYVGILVGQGEGIDTGGEIT
jgi:hypothetical protein